jgi:nucleoside 2-deoxyribosyltransferase/predicted secreted protein
MDIMISHTAPEPDKGAGAERSPGYIFICPCIQDPDLRARGITTEQDISDFSQCLERCRHFGIETVNLPCLETIYLGREREPGSFSDRLDTPGFLALINRMEEEVRNTIKERGEPIAILGVDSSPTCGVNTTYASDTREPGRGVFLTRFPEIRTIDVRTFARWRIYLAAPLFTEAEQVYNEGLYWLLTSHFFSVYFPQEVGDTSHARGEEEHKRIFDRHLEALKNADIVVAVIDGADADSGTAWEMGYASALGKPVFSLRTDFRHAGHHEMVNLMLEQSSIVLKRREDLPKALCSPLYHPERG